MAWITLDAFSSSARRLGRFWLLPILTGAVAFPAGAAPEVTRDELGLTLRHAAGTTRVEFWDKGIVRVRHGAAAALPADTSLVVIAKPLPTTWQYRDEGDRLYLTTANLRVELTKDQGLVEFRNAQGTVVLAEAPPATAGTPAPAPRPATAVGQSFRLDPKEAVYGLGQHQEGRMNYIGRRVRLLQQNTQVAVPLLLSSKGYALLWDNAAVTDVDVGAADKACVSWASEAGEGVDYYFLYGPSPDQAIAAYRQLTGAAPMLGRWAWGFWQCRERYGSQQELLDVVAEYRRRGVPLDGIIQDWLYWAPAPWGSHEFDPKRYPDPAGMVQTLHDQHVHLLISVWPKFDVGGRNLAELEQAGAAYNAVIPYVAPKGQGKWYDPFSPAGRQIYWQQIRKQLFDYGVDGWWLDASEPELSGKWGEFREFQTAAGPGARVFNAYPLMHTTAVYQGQRAASSTRRVLILTRSAFAGQQRNASIVWSGDIRGSWEVFARQIPAGLNLAASGIPYWNTDIGGFFGGDPADPKYAELFTRWFQFGAFCPMFRVHGTGKPKELWRFPPATQPILADTIALRYRLLPYLYAVSWQVTSAGSTMMRPLVMDFADDPQVLGIADQYMFGPALLVAPVIRAGQTARAVYLPAGTKWFDFRTGRVFAGGQAVQVEAPLKTLPLFVRAGAIVPLGPSVQYALDQPDGPIDLWVYGGADGDFCLYEDDGVTYDYEQGKLATIPVHWDDAAGMLTLGARQGAFPGMVAERTYRVFVVEEGRKSGIATEPSPSQTLRYRGEAVKVKCR